MKKRIICFLMTISIAMSLFITASADGMDAEWIFDGTTIHNAWDEERGDGWSYDKTTSTLTLDNFTGTYIWFITSDYNPTLTIILKNNSFVEHFVSEGYNVVFEGDGTLNITGGVVNEKIQSDTYGSVKTSRALEAYGQGITVKSGILNVSPTVRNNEPGELYYGIVCGTFTQNGGSVNITLPDTANTYYEDISCDAIALNGGTFSSNKNEINHDIEDEHLYDEWISYPSGEKYQVNAVAKQTSSQIFINGKQVDFEAYNINDNNYFKLRDIAYALMGTEKQFDVSWEYESIMLKPNQAYTIVGGEMESKGLYTVNAKLSHNISLGHEVGYGNDETLFRGIYNIADNNYFKLRDVGKYFDFDVSWDGVNNAVLIDTTKGYTND